MKRKRDDFSVKVIRDLERRVGSRCSNPECRVPTSGPKASNDGVQSIGIAAHITAASEGGPRFDPSLAKEERTSIGNAIWLCANCSIKIDKDPSAYSVSTLRSWKSNAEQEAAEELGKEPVSRKEYDHLHGLAIGQLKKTRVADAVSSMATLSKKALEELDPRFAVDVSYKDKATLFTLRPKETVSVQTTIAAPFAHEFCEKFAALQEHGQDLEIDLSGVSFQGSKLLELQLPDGAAGKLKLSSNSRITSVLKLSSPSPSGLSLILNDVQGELVVGSKSATFSGTVCGDILHFEVSFSVESSQARDCSGSVSLNFAAWRGKSIKSLPYFGKVVDFYRHLYEGGALDLEIECEGLPVIKARGSRFNENQEIREKYVGLLFLEHSRTVLGALALDTQFEGTFCVTADGFDKISWLAYLLSQYGKLRGKDIGSFCMSLILNNEAVFHALVSGEPLPLLADFAYDWSVQVFGLTLRPPRMRLCYSSVRGRVKGDVVPETIRAGTELRLEFEPTDECTVHVEPLKGI